MDPVSNACDELFEDIAGSDKQVRLLVAFSGGMDSTVLLHALAQSGARSGRTDQLVAVHVDHVLQEDSQRWADHCAAVAGALGVAFESTRLAVAGGSNLEARARSARYSAFESWLNADDILLLAHHAGDQLESQLLHLFQGRGLYGMPGERALGSGWLRRPLLGLPRATLEAYARSHELEWLDDPSNEDQSLDRNFLRHGLLPELGKRFHGLADRIHQVSENLIDSASAMDELGQLQRQPLPLSLFDGLSQRARVALLRRWLNRHAGEGGVSRLALIEFLSQLEAGNDRQPSLALPKGQLVRFQRALHLVPPAPVLAEHYPLEVPGILQLPHGQLTLRPAEEGAEECVLVKGPLTATFATQGLQMRTGGHSRGIRELMRTANVPPWRRETLPLLTDSAGVALIPGVAVRDPVPELAGGISVTATWIGEAR